MSSKISKHRDAPLSELSNASDQQVDDDLHPDSAAALKEVMTAFVDLGFGVSPTQRALNAANDNRSLLELASNFHRNAA